MELHRITELWRPLEVIRDHNDVVSPCGNAACLLNMKIILFLFLIEA